MAISMLQCTMAACSCSMHGSVVKQNLKLANFLKVLAKLCPVMALLRGAISSTASC
jgi:hypothetical protein